MRRMLTLAAALSLAGGGALAAQDTTQMAATATPSAVTVEAVLTHDVVDRMPQDTATAFPAEVGAVALWTRVTGGEGQTLSHVWFFGDTEVGNVPLNIGGSPWRTWSRKQIPPEATGAWHVEVRDAAGNVLQRVDFSIGQ